MSVTLSPTGEAILEPSEPLSSFVIRRSGALGTEHRALRVIITRMAKAINAQQEHLLRLQNESDEAHGLLHASEEQCSALGNRFHEIEDGFREIKIQLANIQEEASKPAEINVEELNKIRDEVMKVALERSEEVVRQIEVVDRGNKEEFRKLTGQLASTDETLKRLGKSVDEEIEQRLLQTDEMVLGLKMDLERLHVHIDESLSRKANKQEVLDMQVELDSVFEGQKQEAKTLQEAHQNLEKLDGCVSLAMENKERFQTLWKVCKEESQDLRVWASQIFAEIKTAVRGKMDEAEAVSLIRDLRNHLRDSSSTLAEATSRVEAGIRRKADSGDLVRLQDAVQNFKSQTGRPTQLLMGTKCLACDRPITSSEATDQSREDRVMRKQQEELFEEVQKALVRSPPGTARHHGEDVLQYVAVHVGSQMRLRDNIGKGAYEARNTQDITPGSHHLVAAGSRPGTRGGPGPLVNKALPAGQAPSPERSPAKQVPPLVRVEPRRTGRPKGAQSALVHKPPPPTTHPSLRAALATTERQRPDGSPEMGGGDNSPREDLGTSGASGRGVNRRPLPSMEMSPSPPESRAAGRDSMETTEGGHRRYGEGESGSAEADGGAQSPEEWFSGMQPGASVS